MPTCEVDSTLLAFQPAKLTYHAAFGLDERRTNVKSDGELAALNVEPVVNLVSTPSPVLLLAELPGVRHVVFS